LKQQVWIVFPFKLGSIGVKTLSGHSVQIFLVSEWSNDINDGVHFGLCVGFLIFGYFFAQNAVIADLREGHIAN
jgi:hypothetical protein